jgi:hypothetical protein
MNRLVRICAFTRTGLVGPVCFDDLDTNLVAAAKLGTLSTDVFQCGGGKASYIESEIFPGPRSAFSAGGLNRAKNRADNSRQNPVVAYACRTEPFAGNVNL